MKDLHVTIRLKNNRLFSRRKAAGLTIKQMGERIGLASYGEFERIAKSPFGSNGKILASAQLIADYWGVGIDELWPNAILSVANPVAEREMDAEEMLPLSAPEARLQLAGTTPESDFTKREQLDMVDAFISKLSKRKQRVIRLRVEGHTLEEIGREMMVTGENVRRIEARAHFEMKNMARIAEMKHGREVDPPKGKADIRSAGNEFVEESMKRLPLYMSKSERDYQREGFLSTGRALDKMKENDKK